MTVTTTEIEESVEYVRIELNHAKSGRTKKEVIGEVMRWIGDEGIQAGFDYAVKNKIIVPLKTNYFGEIIWILNPDKK